VDYLAEEEEATLTTLESGESTKVGRERRA